MDETGFSQPMRAQLRRINGPSEIGYWSFLPPALPPKGFEFSGEVVQALSRADRALGELAGVGRNLPNPHLLIGTFKRREAVLSSKIEGTQAGADDLVLFEADRDRKPLVPDVREVWNYSDALDHGLERLNELPLSKRLILELHARLMSGVRGDEQTPGEFRRTQNWIGPPQCLLRDATFVPPSPEHLHDCLDEFERFLHQPSGLPLLIRLAMIHYQFEAIHPFLDGNGRVGRLLISLLLVSEGSLPGPLLYLSAYFERRRSEYYQGLLAVSQKGAWREWIGFFLAGVEEQSRDAIARAKTLLELREGYRKRLTTARSSSLLLKLVDKLFERPVTTVGHARLALGVTQPSAQKCINRLVEVGLLVEATGRLRDRIWVAREIRDVIG